MLPDDQKEMIWTSLKRDKIIKILKSDCLLNDCIQVHDYKAWYTENYKTEVLTPTPSAVPTLKQPEYKLAFK